MNLNEEIFKAYDVRGVYPESLNEEVAYCFGRAFVDFLKPKNIVVGYDARLSSQSIKESLEKGIIEQGVDVYDIGLCTTPLLNFTVAKNKKYEAGIMITASHNPRQYNGFKSCREDGGAIGEANGLSKIKEIILGQKYSLADIKGRIQKVEAIENYVNYLKKLIDFNSISGLKIAVDASNGSAGETIVKIFENLNCELEPIYFNPDGNFPNHEPDPLKEKNLVKIQEKVKEKKVDLGVVFDGDADRIRFVDEKGKSLPGDLITAFLSGIFLEKEKAGGVVYDLRSSWMVKNEIEKHHGKPIICRVGHTFIKEKMRKEKAIFAGEVSGHYYYRDLFYTDNADFTLLKIMEALVKSDKSFSQIMKPFKKYFQTNELNFEVANQSLLLKDLENYYQSVYPKATIFKLDGLSIELPDFWFNVRPSNTEPILRVKLEAKSKEKMEEKVNELLRLIKK
jgi:phosphomannomutase